MKVIVASLPKCGTKTMHKCLEILGYSVCDFDTNFFEHGRQWEKIFMYGSRPSMFQKMYEGVDVVCDNPAAYYWQEILQAFPESKVILTMRRNEDEWLKSYEKHLTLDESNVMLVLYLLFTPTGRRYHRYYQMMGRIVYSCPPQSFRSILRQPNSQIIKKRYREHNDIVMSKVPKDRLLVLDFSDGWKPLCDFLGKKIPDLPFPRENVGGSLNLTMQEMPFYIQMEKEFYYFVSCVVVAIGLLCFLLYFPCTGS